MTTHGNMSKRKVEEEGGEVGEVKAEEQSSAGIARLEVPDDIIGRLMGRAAHCRPRVRLMTSVQYSLRPNLQPLPSATRAYAGPPPCTRCSRPRSRCVEGPLKVRPDGGRAGHFRRRGLAAAESLPVSPCCSQAQPGAGLHQHCPAHHRASEEPPAGERPPRPASAAPPPAAHRAGRQLCPAAAQVPLARPACLPALPACRSTESEWWQSLGHRLA